MRHDGGEAGITLVEIMISLIVLGVVLTAFFGVSTRNLRSISDSQARQEASFSASQVIETLYELPVTSARMSATYDPTLVSCQDTSGVVTTGSVDVFGDGSVCEELAIDPSIVVDRIDDTAPWTGTSDAVSYATYATVVAGTEAVRVTVIADYELTDGPKEIRRSTLISEVDRG